MAITIMEALQNADYNLRGSTPIQKLLGANQLHNAVILLEKGYDLSEMIDPILGKYTNVDDVPDKD